MSTLALGSAYFRTEQLSRRRARIQSRDCRRPQGRRSLQQPRRRVPADRRYKEADEAVKAAEKAGFKVHPQLKQDIKDKLDK